MGALVLLFAGVAVLLTAGSSATAGTTGATAAVAGTTGGTGAATANATSANWSGYAIHGDGAAFKRASGIWTVPRLQCTPGRSTYSAVWVGIGGFNLNARALEQTGTEVDCRRNGRIRANAWYEVVPAPSHRASIRVRPGDLIAASVAVNGNQVRLTLRDLTSHRHFAKKLTVRRVDLRSAEWIVEAPSNCISASSCETLPLADFGHVRFTHAAVETTNGRRGTISSSHWRTTKITLSSANRALFRFLGQVAKATPSALTDAGAAFNVVYSLLSVNGPGRPAPDFGPRREFAR